MEMIGLAVGENPIKKIFKKVGAYLKALTPQGRRMIKLKIEKKLTTEKECLIDKLVEFNAEQVPFLQDKPFIDLSHFLKTEDNAIVGGMRAILYCWNCLYIETMWIEEKYRRQGFGTKLMKKVEEAAVAEGCYLAHLDTFDFQARDFYLKLGYEVFGELENCPPGHKRYYLRKYFKCL